MYDKIKPSKKRVKKNVAALNSLIEEEDSIMTKRKFRLKPLIIAAAIAVVSMASLITVNAANKGAIVKFFTGSEEVDGEYYDYVDKDGFRRVSFAAVVPIDEDTYAAIYDVDAPQGENVRVLTPESDPEFFENLGLFREAQDKAIEKSKAVWAKIKAWKDFDQSDSYAWDAVKQEAIEAGVVDPSEFPVNPKPGDYGFVFKDSEICLWSCSYIEYVDEETHHHNRQGSFGGKFMNMGAAEWKGSGVEISGGTNECHYDYENETRTIRNSFYYYVGKEQQIKNSKEIEGEYYDNVDKNGNRHITFDAVLPYEEMSYAIVYDIDAPKDKNVRFLTPATDPDFFVNVRRYLDDLDKHIKESAAMWDKIDAWKGDYDKSDSRLRDAVLQEAIEAGIVDPSEVPEDVKPEDYLFECKDSELCVWEYIYRDEPGYNHSSGGSFGGKFLNTGKSGEQKFEEKRLGDGTKAIKHTFKFYAGNEE